MGALIGEWNPAVVSICDCPMAHGVAHLQVLLDHPSWAEGFDQLSFLNVRYVYYKYFPQSVPVFSLSY